VLLIFISCAPSQNRVSAFHIWYISTIVLRLLLVPPPPAHPSPDGASGPPTRIQWLARAPVASNEQDSCQWGTARYGEPPTPPIQRRILIATNCCGPSWHMMLGKRMGIYISESSGKKGSRKIKFYSETHQHLNVYRALWKTTTRART